MRYFPIFLDLQDRNVVVVGGGEAAGDELFVLEPQRFPVDIVPGIVSPATTAFSFISRDDIASQILRGAS